MGALLSEVVFEARDVSAIYRWMAAARRGPSVGQRVSAIYTGLVVAGILGVLLYGTASTALAQVVSAGSVARWGPSLMMLAFLGAGFWGAVQGPVVFSPADVAVLLGAPLPRARLVTRPLRRAFVLGALVGLLVAGVLVVGLTGDRRHVVAARMIGLGVGLGLAGVIGVAVAWLVSISARVERGLQLVSWPVVLVAGGLGVGAAAGARTGRLVALWSGPWGWTVQAGAGKGPGSSSGWIAALAAVAVVAALLVGVVWSRRAGGETERFARRAEGRAHLEASLMAFDARTSRRNLASVAGTAAGSATGSAAGGRGTDVSWLRSWLSAVRSARLGGRGAVELAVLWRCVVNAAHSRSKLVLGGALAAGGAAFVLLDVRRAAGVVAGAVLIYCAAACLLEPMRIELDAPGRSSVFLGARPGRALLAHALFPALVVAGSVALCAGVLAVFGLLGGGDLTAALVLVVTAPAVTCCAGMSARRGGRLPTDVLITAVTSDPSGGGLVLLGWLLIWPAVAAATVFVPVRAIHAASPVAGTLASVAVGLVAVGVSAAALSRDPR